MPESQTEVLYILFYYIIISIGLTNYILKYMYHFSRSYHLMNSIAPLVFLVKYDRLVNLTKYWIQVLYLFLEIIETSAIKISKWYSNDKN